MENKCSKPLFGPSGHDDAFVEEGNTVTLQMPKWLKNKGLDIFEYSFGRGVRISSETAEAIGAEADKYGIEMSVHAPYFINFASVEQDKADNSITYLTSSQSAETFPWTKMRVSSGRGREAAASGGVCTYQRQFLPRACRNRKIGTR